MQTLLVSPATQPEADYGSGLLPSLIMPSRRKTSTRQTSLDSLLKTPSMPDAPTEAAPAIELDPGPGAFGALRVALLFNAAVGVAGLLCYEVWTGLAR